MPRTFALLREATDVLLEATPRGVDMEHVRRHILDAPGVVDCHDLHAWTITSGMNVVSAHVILADGADAAGVLDALCACLSGDFDIEHSAFQLETADRRRLEAQVHTGPCRTRQGSGCPTHPSERLIPLAWCRRSF